MYIVSQISFCQIQIDITWSTPSRISFLNFCINMARLWCLHLFLLVTCEFNQVASEIAVIKPVGDKICTPVLPELVVGGPCKRKQCDSDKDCRRGRICCLTMNQRCRRCLHPDRQGGASRERGFQFKLKPWITDQTEYTYMSIQRLMSVSSSYW